MAIRDVLRYPDARLKRRAREATLDEAARVAADLVDTMRAFTRCVGVAAPQVGDEVRICVVDCTDHPKAPDAHGLLVLVNPVIVASAGSVMGREGCLSIPDLTANVLRAERVTVEAVDAHGAAVRVESAGFEARALQHEIDHLDGLLFLDRVRSPDDVFARKRTT
jgi:peptide deformylase